MSKFNIDTVKTQNEITAILGHKDSLDKQREQMKKVCEDLFLGNDTETIKQVIEGLETILSKEEQQIVILANALQDALNCYTDTESRIIAYINSQGEIITTPEGNGENAPSDPTNTPSDDKDKDDEPFNVYDWLSEQTGIPKEVIDIIATILSFIPVINCVTDIIDIVNDVSAAWGDDHKISFGEAGVIIFDIVNLGMDIVAAGEIIKGLSKAVKTAKSAKTAAKTADEAAKIAAKKAEKAAAKTGGSVPVTKAAKKATKAAKEADKAKDKAKVAKEAWEAAKQAEKEQLKEIAKKTGENAKDYFIGDGSDQPGIVKEEASEYIMDTY